MKTMVRMKVMRKTLSDRMMEAETSGRQHHLIESVEKEEEKALLLMLLLLLMLFLLSMPKMSFHVSVHPHDSSCDS